MRNYKYEVRLKSGEKFKTNHIGGIYDSALQFDVDIIDPRTNKLLYTQGKIIPWTSVDYIDKND